MSNSPIQPEAAALKPGDKLDKYEVRRVIGQGGMATVYEGYDALLDRRVALKQLNPDLAAQDDQFIERFRREAKLQRRVALNHKHLITVIDVLEEKRGLFLVQEFVDGPSLEQVLTENPGPMETRKALGIIGATALALEAIHAKGIIHHDLKPSNILLPNAGGLKVSDFGLATMIAEQETLSLGSVRYMAPELFRDEPFDTRADLYALGMIAYEMLAGRTQFNEAFRLVLRDQRNQALRWMKWHTNSRALAPPLSQIEPGISDTLSDLVARLMAKDPTQRIASASELLDTIRRHFTPGSPGSLGAPGSPGADSGQRVGTTPTAAAATASAAAVTHTAPLPQPSRLPWMVAALLAVNVLVGLGVWGWYTYDQRQRQQETRAAIRLEMKIAHQAYREGRYDEALSGYQAIHADWLQDAEFGKVAQAGMFMAQAHLDFAAGRYPAVVQAVDQARDLGVVRDVDRLIALRDDALIHEAFAKEVQRIEELLAADLYNEARIALNQQRKQNPAGPLTERLDELGRRIEGQENQQQIQAVMDRVKALVDGGERKQAIQVLAEAVKTLSSRDLESYLDQVRADAAYDAAVAAGNQALADDDLATAAAQFSQALQRRADPDLQKKLDDVLSRASYREGLAALQNGDTAAAEEALRRALGHDPRNAAARDALGKIATTDQKLGFMRAGDRAMRQNDFTTAIKQYQNALAIEDDAAITAKLTQARVRETVAQGQEHLNGGDLAQARTALEAALQLAADDADALALNDDLRTREQFQAHLDAGDAARRTGRYGDAKLAYFKARDVIANDLIRQRIADIEYESLIALAQSYISAKHWTSAKAVLQTALATRDTEQVRTLLAQVKRELSEDR
jgi:serine/threonine-protein kinase